jgi:hypothetical protein
MAEAENRLIIESNKKNSMHEIYDLLKKAYATELAKDVCLETEDAINAFERKYEVTLPTDYKWLLLKFGAFNFGEDPYLYTLEDLYWAYPNFLEAYYEYQEGYPDMPKDIEPFPIGGFGEGSIAILDNLTGKVQMLIHDCADDIPLEDVADSFKVLLQQHAENIVMFWTRFSDSGK